VPEDETTGTVPVALHESVATTKAQPAAEDDHGHNEVLLRFNHVNTFYGQIQVLHDVDYIVNSGLNRRTARQPQHARLRRKSQDGQYQRGSEIVRE